MAFVIVVGGGLDVATLQQSVRAAGLWAPGVFVLFQVVVTFTPVPRTAFSVAAGVLFGAVLGTVVAVVATIGAAALTFWLVRLGTAGLAARHADRRVMAWVRARLERSPLVAVLSFRLMPIVPFAVVNYAFGASEVRFLPYLVGTTIGVLPGTVSVVVLGGAAAGGTSHPALLALSTAYGLFGLVGVLVTARRGKPSGA
ncbi:TVP38/TMEM64 family protein [Nonomuraea jiangxiensis]|uniref:TVP38/TMEM64 family membrane protein n=1 Tax=Nonomuraea jiangxiensis TaxID=633440 RepID=A0A1G8Y029_9ACTN|nr:VTT domain-containing protein [Nonomuraea jiangxiensis]SDJ96111.1 Uncharacterized membrane protein YdjX, TVP38/TMEM64 family, SNARE-associated domain [Nonomuraea jiangxiensis]